MSSVPGPPSERATKVVQCTACWGVLAEIRVPVTRGQLDPATRDWLAGEIQKAVDAHACPTAFHRTRQGAERN